MASRGLTGQSPAFQRLWAYLLERFPPVAYSLLVAFFYGSALLVVSRPFRQEPSFEWQAPLSCCSCSFTCASSTNTRRHEDLKAHPDRLLSRGIVTLDVAQSRLVSIALQALLAALGTVHLGPAGLLWFTLLMLAEFLLARG